MHAQEKEWFKALTLKRENAVKVLEEEGLINVFVSHIVDTYRESAHFIYELLQNADDVKATKVRFELKDEGILFAHNGKVNFSISDPTIERKAGITPGHINAITTFSLSSKKEDIENKIGKFGIGFKSVFQYTDTPHVFNPPFSFIIEDYMIPREVPLVKDMFNQGETTVFWIPFDKEDKMPEEAFNEIKEKLANLKNPLLFLRNLSKVDILYKNTKRYFTKKIKEVDLALLEIKVRRLELNEDTILKFSQNVTVTGKDNVNHILPIDIGFILENEKVSSNEKYQHYFQYAWCFFPTRQETKINYILNAPFILTPNREALKEGRTENVQLINALGSLMENAIQALKSLGFINEEFFTTIPIPTKLPIEFRAIGEKAINKLKKGEFIPTRDGKFIAIADAYVCTESLLVDLLSFDNSLPLQKITKNPRARLVFPERKLFSDQNLFVYFYQNLSGGQVDLNAAWLGSRYTSDVLQSSSSEFDVKFFKYLSERSNVILGKGQPLWNKAFIPVSNGSGKYIIVTPKNSKSETQIFLGGAELPGRYIIADYLVQDNDVAQFLRHTLNFTLPDEFDDFIISLDKYTLAEDSISIEERVADILTIKRFLSEVGPFRRETLMNAVKEIDLLPTTNSEGDKETFNSFKEVVYFPSSDLVDYFSKAGKSVTWIDLKLFSKEPTDIDFKKFLEQLDVEFSPYYFSKSDQLDGAESFAENISLEESIYLVDVLLKRSGVFDLKKNLLFLKKTNWVFDKEGICKAPTQIKVGDLHSKYPSYFEAMHLSLGGLVDNQAQRYAGLNAVERALLEAVTISVEDLSPDEIKAALANLIKEKRAKATVNNNTKTKETDSTKHPTTPEEVLHSWTKDAVERTTRKLEDEALSGHTIPSLPNSVEFWKDESDDASQPENPGGYLSAPIIGTQYQHNKENKKKVQLEKEIELDSKRNLLLELANQFEPYSFGWFKTLLELEDNFTAEDRIKRNPIYVSFGKAELDKDGLLVLSNTVYIPPTIEDIGEISIQLYFDDEKRTIKGEVVSPKKQLLLIKLSTVEQLANIDLSSVTRAVVEASSPDFILERLKTAFANLNFKDTDNLKNPALLPSDLRFVFGPPGTGKTSYLSWLIGGKSKSPIKFKDEEVIPLMEQGNKKVLVLTPTNKAADVLAERILHNYINDNDYPDWLIRFGQTETLEHESIFVGDRNLQPWVYNKCSLVTTIARFPYDFYKIQRDGQEPDTWKIKDFKWDVIIFDEASMIQQAAILYTIFYSRQINPNVQFYIGGDPFQIPPIIQFEYPFWSYLPEPAFDSENQPILDENGCQVAWKQDGGNIYSFVGLMRDDSFIKPKPEPHPFLIHNLITQFRSVVPIGALFSHYRYDNQLKHFRTAERIAANPKLAPLEIDIPKLPLAALNIIRFPVKKYEGIYRVRSIKGSPYHIYSSLFAIELIQYIQRNVRLKKDQTYRIGIISPYAMQSNIVSKLLEKIGMGPIEISVGTVHGFQGDECNLVIVLLNPPRNISRSPRTFLNKKNILNVAISRARDKMIILSPHDPDKELNLHDLHQIRWIEKLAMTKPECKADIKGYHANEIENALWGSETFIEDNSFPTSHQSVNIYTEAVRKYEIRHDENSIDVQIRPHL